MNRLQKIFTILLMLMASVFLFGQTINPPSSIVGEGYGVEKGQTIEVDSLNFRTDQVLLLQDNSTLIIRYKVTGKGRLEYGDVGSNVPKRDQVELPHSETYGTWSDWRNPTDVNGKIIFLRCQDPTEFQLTFGPYVDYEYKLSPILNVDIPSTLLSCNTDVITLTASSTDPSLTYLWSNGQTTPSIAVSAAGIYNVTVTNTEGCSVSSDDITITKEIDVPLVDAGEPKSLNCLVSEVTLGMSYPTTEPDVTYLWSNGATTPQIVVTEAGNYTLTATNTITGCTASDVVVVSLDTAPPIVTISGDYPSLSCSVPQILLTANVGTSTYSYLWDSGETTQQISVIQAGIYGVTVLDEISGCETYTNIIVDDNTTPIVVEISGNTEVCSGEETILTATAGTSWVWSTGETTQTITANPSTTTTYSVVATENGCSDEQSIVVNVYAVPIATLNSDMEIYVGETRTLTAGGGSSFVWSTGETTSSITVTPLVTTTYLVTVSNGNCSSLAQVTITVVEPPAVIANAGNDITICNGDNVILTATTTSSSTATYLWSTGDRTKTINVSPNAHTVYSVIVTDFGKSDEDFVMIRVNQNCN